MRRWDDWTDHDDAGRDHRALMWDSERDIDLRFPSLDEPDLSDALPAESRWER